MKNEVLELDIDYILLMGKPEYNSSELYEEDNEQYILIDNPINRIKDMKY